MYSNAKIFKLYSPEGNDMFIGSSTMDLNKILKLHKYPSNNCRSKELFEKYDNILIEIIENFPCENKKQLTERENEIISNYPNCINKPKQIKIKGKQQNKYYENLEKSRKNKILQKIQNEGCVPTIQSINKYNITINDLLKINNYINKNTETTQTETNNKIFNKTLSRIEYLINQKE